MDAKNIQEVYRNDAEIIGAHIVLCTNTEIVGQNHDIDTDEAGRIISEMADALDDAGWYFDHSNSARFEDWRGGQYSQDGSALAVRWYVADLDDDGEPEQWRSIWRRGPGATEIPAEAIAVLESVEDLVYAAAEREAELINAESHVKSRH